MLIQAVRSRGHKCPAEKKTVYTTSWPMRKTMHVIEMQMNKEIECVLKQRNRRSTKHSRTSMVFEMLWIMRWNCIPLRFYGRWIMRMKQLRTKLIAMCKYLHWIHAYHQVQRIKRNWNKKMKKLLVVILNVDTATNFAGKINLSNIIVNGFALSSVRKNQHFKLES